MLGNIDELKENYNGNKTFGFIYANGDRYFFHKSALRNCTIFQLDEGDAVEFDPCKDDACTGRKGFRGRRCAAVAEG